MRRQLLFLTLALIIGASMSLFDIDRHNDDRGNPAPNHTDSLTDGSIKSHGTLSTNYVTDASPDSSGILKSGLFRIINTGTLTIPRFTFGAATVTNTYDNIANSPVDSLNYTFTPGVLAYITDNAGTFYQMLPFTTMQSGGTGGGIAICNVEMFVAPDTISASAHAVAYGAFGWSAVSWGPFTVRYYLLQQTAN